MTGRRADTPTIASVGADDRRRALPPAVRWLAVAWALASTADTFLLFALFWIASVQGWSGPEIAAMVLALRLPCPGGGRAGWLRRGSVRSAPADAGGSGLPGTAPMTALAIVGRVRRDRPPRRARARRPGRRVVTGQLRGCAHARPSTRAAGPVECGERAARPVGDQLTLLLGALLVGPAVALVGIGPALLVPAALLAVAGWITARLPRTAAPAAVPATADAGDRDRPPWRSPRVVALIALSVAYYAADGLFEPVLAAFTREELHGGALSYGALWSVFGVERC